ncbi:hypothetical protein B0A52_01909 [Exophiala mesophila]|uniref:Uncharacterized protein n=1 Tax=Exophiala mesophila TaxID=212818 RepID=A0A438NEC2_EXOME|nr:hypothetical protein B0A52_01909 [Exophiala mesophila]
MPLHPSSLHDPFDQKGTAAFELAETNKSSPRVRMAIDDAFARASNRQKRMIVPATDRSGNKETSVIEAPYVDRLKLTHDVLGCLKSGDISTALELVRRVYKSPTGVVIDTVMKKRGHKPDSQTFTILLYGFKQNVNKTSGAVSRAIQIYNSMYASNSAVKPNVIHTNTVLSVCARGHDMSQLWAIVGRLPDRGPDAADHITYTTILTAITADARKRALELGEKDGDPGICDGIFEEAVADGRKLWSDVTARWRRGDLEIDEHLVTAMGRLLLLSKDAENHKIVFTLAEQTMRLSTFDEKLAKMQANQMRLQDELAQEDDASEKQDEPDQNLVKLQQHNSSTTHSFLEPRSNSVFATPGNKTLSLLLHTATSLREIDAGKRYWRLITSQDGPFKVHPDISNYADYLRLLRIARASKEALTILQSIPEKLWPEMANKGIFLIAMSTCMRDKNNPNVFGTATEILCLMQTKLVKYAKHDPSETDGSNRELRILSPTVLEKYVQVAMETTHGMTPSKLAKQPNGDLDFERDPKKNNIINALNRLGSSTSNAERLLKIFVEEYQRQVADTSRTVRVTWLLRKRAEAPEHVAELLQYFQTLLAAYEKLLAVNERLEDEGLGPLEGDFLREITAQRRYLSTLITKTNNVKGIRGRTNSWSPKEKDVFRDQVPRNIAEVVNELSPPSKRDKSTANHGTKVDDSAEVESADRAEIRQNITSRHALISGDSSLRGLSRRQRLEVEKEDRIRAKFPETLLRDRSDKHRPGSKRPQVDKGRLGVRYHPSQRESAQERISESDRRRAAARLRYQVTHGWGSEFTDLAKEQGQSTATELRDLRS